MLTITQLFRETGALKNFKAEVESSRTFLASRTHFEVLGLGLEASSPRKLPCPWLEDSTIFWTVKILLDKARNEAKNLRRPVFVILNWWSPEKNFLKPEKNFWEPFFLEIAWKFFKHFFFRTFAPVTLVLDLEHFCPWPREGLSLEGLP